MNAEFRQQQVANEGADNADDDVTNEPKSGSPDEVPGQPPGHKTNQQYDEETLI
jgi:hypothetical protein